MFVTSLVHTKLCLSQTIPHCKGELCLSQTAIPHCRGEQNYGGVTLFLYTDICSVQDQMTVSAADSDSYTESNISHQVTCYTCACDVKVCMRSQETIPMRGNFRVLCPCVRRKFVDLDVPAAMLGLLGVAVSINRDTKK